MAVSGDQDIAAFEEDGHVVLGGAAAPENRHDPRIHEALAQLWGKPGDLLIRVRPLAHCDGLNTSDTLRFVQYITMPPAGEEDREARQRRIEQIEQRKAPPSAAFRGEPRGREREQARAELTPCDRRLPGLDRR